MNISEKLYGQIMLGYGISFLISALFAMQLAKRIKIDRLLQIGAITLMLGGAMLITNIVRNEISLSYLSIVRQASWAHLAGESPAAEMLPNILHSESCAVVGNENGEA